ncbi:MAG TPA: hypothetical protein VNY35_04245 [Solirubrobacteraceae bacterium]|jgi:hypothetical protein|nr:hypothetical protein [Solirubrobacteraceae bacterium]
MAARSAWILAALSEDFHHAPRLLSSALLTIRDTLAPAVLLNAAAEAGRHEEEPEEAGIRRAPGA